MKIEEIESFITKVPDFPKPGILFYDVSTLFFSKEAFASSLDHFEKLFTEFKFDTIAAIDARGFIFGSALAYKLKLGMMMIRKKNKLPGKKISFEYDLEYGKDILEINISVENKKFLLIDDLLATGGTANAAVKLIEKAGGNVSCFGSLIELSFLDGRNKLAVPVRTLIKY
jgi:adenine phosphoribosyltransferase|tara:strand:+ start:328 stop:840 length:513 start_codon:yes stop_codon:yes gene_type:complete